MYIKNKKRKLGIFEKVDCEYRYIKYIKKDKKFKSKKKTTKNKDTKRKETHKH